MGDLHHLHRAVHVPLRTLDDIAREHGIEAQHRAEPIAVRRETLGDDLLDFIADLRANRDLALLCATLGLIAGMMLTAGLAFVIGLFL